MTTEIVIGQPAERRRRLRRRPRECAQAWYAEHHLRHLGNQPAVACRIQANVHARFLGRQLAYTYEITNFVPAERLVMRTAQGPFPMETTYTWQPRR